MAHVFISYVRDNSDQVDRLATILRTFGISVWLDRDSIAPGLSWKDAIRTAIREGGLFLACFSLEYENRVKTHMNEELLLAIEEVRLRPSDRAWFIPIRLNDVTLPSRSIGAGESIADIQAVDMFPSWEDGVRRLLAAIQPTSGVVYELSTRLSNTSARVRIAAADELAKLGSLAASAGPQLRSLLRDENETVRAAAASALGSIGIHDEALVLDLLRIAGDDGHSHYPRKHASKALVSIGDGVVDSLLRVAAGEDGDLAEAAHVTIVEIGARGLPLLYQALRREGPTKAAAIRALARIPQPSPPRADSVLEHVEQLLLTLKNADDKDKPLIIDALAALRHPAAVETLIQELRDSNYICVSAALALQKMGDPRSIEPLTQVLLDPERFWVPRGAAAAALGHMGPVAVAALPALRDALTFQPHGEKWDERARDAVVDAIAHLTEPNSTCILRGKGYRYEMWGIY